MTTILGVKIDDISQIEAVKEVEGWLKSGKKHFIVTPNPEFIVAAQKDMEFKDILNKADLSIPDGIGLKLSGKIKNRVTGVDLMLDLVKMASEKGYSVGFLGGKNGVVETCAQIFKKKYPNLKISFADAVGEVDQNGVFVSTLTTNYLLLATDLLFVGFGHGKQEKWIGKNLANLPVKVAMGVGGAFDYISGTLPRAPKMVRNVGFEWLYRLGVQPWRIKRQIALVKYIWSLKTSKS